MHKIQTKCLFFGILDYVLTNENHWLTTAGEGMWMIDTERGRTWLANWQRTVPLDNASPRSSGREIFRRDSRDWKRNMERVILLGRYSKKILLKLFKQISGGNFLGRYFTFSNQNTALLQELNVWRNPTDPTLKQYWTTINITVP